MIDASHGNSEQGPPPPAAWSRATSPRRWRRARRGIIGVMMESFLVDGRQDLVDRARLVYGQSITDACMGWEATGRCSTSWPRPCARAAAQPVRL